MEVFLEKWQHLMADGVPLVVWIEIGEVFAEAQLVVLQVGQEVLASYPQERPDEVIGGLGEHTRHAGRAGAANQPEQDFFSLVVGGVSQGDGVRSEADEGILEKPMAAGAGGHFQGNMVQPVVSPHIGCGGFQGQAQGGGQGSHEGLVLGGCCPPELMVEMENGQLPDAAAFPQACQQMQKGHRIRPARYGDQDGGG